MIRRNFRLDASFSQLERISQVKEGTTKPGSGNFYTPFVVGLFVGGAVRRVPPVIESARTAYFYAKFWHRAERRCRRVSLTWRLNPAPNLMMIFARMPGAWRSV